MGVEQRQSLVMPVDEHRDHVHGGAVPGAVTLVVYGDYECPYTRAAYRSVEQIEDRLGERLRFVFRHFPLRSIHPHAQMAAEAAEEAAAQDRYWDMHDVLFGHQLNLDRGDLERYARELELDIDNFEAALSDGRHRARIQQDVDAGELAGVAGTPTLFIEGLLYSGSRSRDDLELALLEARAQP